MYISDGGGVAKLEAALMHAESLDVVQGAKASGDGSCLWLKGFRANKSAREFAHHGGIAQKPQERIVGGGLENDPPLPAGESGDTDTRAFGELGAGEAARGPNVFDLARSQ